jgi:DNA (cytosine-5)-methyltransferase 1
MKIVEPSKLTKSSQSDGERTVTPSNAANVETVGKVTGQGNTERTFIDLFCGCGGFTLGMVRAGFNCVAAIDSDESSIGALKKNMPSISNILQKDLTKYAPQELSRLTGLQRVDVIVGGPPCQGFSVARSVDGTNHGFRLKRDRRRLLYREFLKYVAYFQPKAFVMENVLGIRNTANGEYFTRVHHEARNLGKADGHPGYRVHAQIEDARALGVPQKRRRQLIIGVRADLPSHFIPQLLPAQRAMEDTNLGDAIGDLPIVRAGSGNHERQYDLQRRAKHLARAGAAAKNYLFNVLEVDRSSALTSHVARPHSGRDLRDFSRLREGESSTIAMRDRKVKFEFPYDKSSFKDRYTRQSRWQPCSTIVAHLSKDGLMFIHPTQSRSLTPREAARVQSFPDWFSFPESRTIAYRLIGNAVPPLVAESVGNAVAGFLSDQLQHTEPNIYAATIHANSRLEPFTEKDVVQTLITFAGLPPSHLRAVDKESFLPAWRALLKLFPDLHPDNALDHGVEKTNCPSVAKLFPKGTAVRRRRYVRSGWPVAFESMGREAWRRRQSGDLEISELYLLATVRSGNSEQVSRG